MSPLTLFKCLADDTRLKSLMLIALHKELCVCDLIQALDLSQPKISRHLAELRKCGVVSDERRGKWVFYRLKDSLPDWAREIICNAAANNDIYLQNEQANLTRLVAQKCC